MKGEGAAEAINGMGEQMNQESTVKIGQNRETVDQSWKCCQATKAQERHWTLNLIFVGVKNII